MGNNSRNLISFIFNSFKMLKSNPSSHLLIKDGEAILTKANNNNLRGMYLSKDSVYELIDGSKSSEFKAEIVNSSNSISILIHKNI